MSIFTGFVIGVVCGVLIYFGTRIAVGEKANSLPGGAVAAGLIGTPWWAGVVGGLLAHALCVVAVKRYRAQRANSAAGNSANT